MIHHPSCAFQPLFPAARVSQEEIDADAAPNLSSASRRSSVLSGCAGCARLFFVTGLLPVAVLRETATSPGLLPCCFYHKEVICQLVISYHKLHLWSSESRYISRLERYKRQLWTVKFDHKSPNSQAYNARCPALRILCLCRSCKLAVGCRAAAHERPLISASSWETTSSLKASTGGGRCT
jgi:hypothetical protein